ncbi:hypothetical protein CC80DRAFT_567851 [Byssothecium circinans]|uniref:NAD(P)-binding protein n=1 Tax=Byssothecium circinans TaxID=147558 RepID=A0A6A5TMY1_9PLEO|nr:hypothetical protein CC80DRAFT_567851 [Byssothecium circinans]
MNFMCCRRRSSGFLLVHLFARIMETINLNLSLEGSRVIVTGDARPIGQVIIDHFVAAGAKVSSLDISHPAEARSSQDDDLSGPLALHYCDGCFQTSCRSCLRSRPPLMGLLRHASR